ncbi:MAG: hypothetical protein JWN76_2312 [Chitinophagaceae bacterium]|nr:hypothetical protein [Chitinophagaceae bacterium]
MLFGNYIELDTTRGQIGGFIPSSEVASITEWIKENKINTFAGLEKLYDSLSPEVQNALRVLGVRANTNYLRPILNR